MLKDVTVIAVGIRDEDVAVAVGAGEIKLRRSEGDAAGDASSPHPREAVSGTEHRAHVLGLKTHVVQVLQEIRDKAVMAR